MDAFVAWDETLLLGVETLDRQHAELFQVLNELHAQRNTEPDLSGIGAPLLRLQIYTETHFRTEEVLMKYAGYPGYAEHQKVHRDMVGQTNHIVTTIHVAAEEGRVEMIRYLADWWTDHIREYDRDCARYLQALPVSVKTVP